MTAIRYVRYAPGLQIVLARNALFALLISVIPALMPVVGFKALHLNPSALALGGVIWGSAVTAAGTTYTLLGAAVLFLISLALADRLSINFTGTLNFDPAAVTSFSHKLIYTPHPHDGPMSITVEFNVDCAHGREFMDLLREVRLIHLRNGAYSWRLHEDLTRPIVFA